MIKFITILGFTLLSVPFFSDARTLFPFDTQTKHFELSGTTTTYPLATSTRTILGLEISRDSGQIWIYCGSQTEDMEIYETHNFDSAGYVNLNYVCYDNIIFRTSGVSGQGGHIVLNYVNYDTFNYNDVGFINIKKEDDYMVFPFSGRIIVWNSSDNYTNVMDSISLPHNFKADLFSSNTVWVKFLLINDVNPNTFSDCGTEFTYEKCKEKMILNGKLEYTGSFYSNADYYYSNFSLQKYNGLTGNFGGLDNNKTINYIVSFLIIITGILGLDLIRRLFYRSKK